MKIKRCFRALLRQKAISLAASLLLLAGAAQADTPHVPDWVKQAAAQPMPHMEPRTNAVILLREDTITVAEDGQATRYHREVRKIVTAKGRDARELEVSFDSSSKVKYLHSWTIAPDGHEFQTKDEDVLEGSAYERFILYSDTKVKAVRAIAAEQGAVVAFEYERRERPYSPDELFQLQERVPVAHQTITLNLPAGWEYSTAFTQIKPVPAKQAGANSWQWDIAEQAALREELLAPSEREMGARMNVTYFGGARRTASRDWKSLGLWYQQLTQGRNETSPEIAAKTAEIVSGHADFAGKLRAITGFMQDQIRYVAIEIAVGGFQPHSATDVFHNRYGDCKDKATLLISMLRSAGIHANYLIVDVDHAINPELPSTNANHMIVAIDLPPDVNDDSFVAVVKRSEGKRVLIFDPTDSNDPAGELEESLQGTYGVLVDGAASELIRLPVLGPSQNVLRRQGDFVLGADGVLKGDFVEKRTGAIAGHYRGLFSKGDTKLERDRSEHMLKEWLPNFTLESFNAEHVAERDQPLLIHYKIAADGYGRTSGSMLMVRPRVLGSVQEPVRMDEPRRYPVQFDGERSQIEDYTVHFPDSYKVEDVPDAVSLDTDFASYTSKTEVVGNTLHYTREYRLKMLDLPAARYSELTKFVGEVANDERNQAILRKVN
jgi:hypothetical protein